MSMSLRAWTPPKDMLKPRNRSTGAASAAVAVIIGGVPLPRYRAFRYPCNWPSTTGMALPIQEMSRASQGGNSLLGGGSPVKVPPKV